MGRKLECDALVDETCKLGLYVTVEPSVDAIHMPDYAHRNFTAHGLRPSISVHTRGGKKNHSQETRRSFWPTTKESWLISALFEVLNGGFLQKLAGNFQL